MAHHQLAKDSQRDWQNVRRHLNQRRHLLGPMAAKLQPEHQHPAGVLVHPDWLPPAPVDLDHIALATCDEPGRPEFTGTEPVTEQVRPMTRDAGRYRRYSDAVHELARPSLFDDRPCYRPTAIAWTGTRGQLRFERTTYFAALDVCEALAHEHAAAWLANGQQPPSASQLPFRGAVRDPFDFLRRPMATSINTLTMRRTESGTATVLLHKRNAAAVASAGGMYHVIPAGTFQPSSATQWVEDLDLWRNIMREISEELLGRPEHDPDDTGGVDYTAEPYRSLDQARRAGRLRAVCLGIVVEPLTWWVEAQTVVVVDAHTFDDIFGTVAAHNEEGDLVAENGHDQISVGIPFTADSMRRLARTPLAPVALHLLQTAWLHRADLLSG